MKISNYFFGFLLIGLGVLWLDSYFDIINFDYPSFQMLWPLSLVFLGLSILNFPKVLKQLFSASAGLILAVVIMSFVFDAERGFSKIKLKIDKKIEKEIEDNTNDEDYFNF